MELQPGKTLFFEMLGVGPVDENGERRDKFSTNSRSAGSEPADPKVRPRPAPLRV